MAEASPKGPPVAVTFTPWMPAPCAVATLPPMVKLRSAASPATLRKAVLTNLGDFASVEDGCQSALCPGFRADADTIGLAAPTASTTRPTPASIAISVHKP